jgi:membrane associated rhomboid family serine protease
MSELERREGPLRAYISANRGMMVLWAICVMLGVGTGVWVLTPFYGAVLGAFGGLIGGLGSALILSANRLIQ